MGRTTAHILVIAILAALVAVAFMRVNYTWNWDGVWEYRQKFIQGWVTTLVLSVAALVGSIVIGMVAAMMLQSRREFVQALARVYVELVRGTPLLVQLLIGFYVVASAVGLDNRFVVGVLSLSLFSGAYMAEIFRGGLAAIPQTQRDAARAIGLSQWQSMRLVILPQALRLVLPPIAGQLVSLIKDSSLLSVIAISEFTLNAQEVNSFTYSALESYLPLAAGYLMLTLPLSWLARLLESRFRYET
ncbi:MAG: amino acid ABC transporter permease [Planctomycetota bacterium]|jgi:polar amino acid transport system permease protein|nr:amino acid ABC transporter permease [Planctomycetia bacterium]MDO7677761.1 amino acid ABC transporter permease [Pirellulales bacterium]RLS55561.1 MAG: amino acid ABC transporter permease [Planctomycetota bacterium]